MNLKIWLFGILALCSTQFVFGQQTKGVAPPVATVSDNGYLVGIGDQLSGTVMNEKQFDFVSSVDENGRLQVPFFDQPIQAKCRTVGEIRIEITELLAKYLKRPQINVQVLQRRSRPPVIVTGEVRTPQQVDLQREARLLDLLSLSGGETVDADGSIKIFRTQQVMCSDRQEESDWRTASTSASDVPSRIYSLNRLREGRDEFNPVIKPGDVIIVEKARPVYITGEVVAPQGILLKEGGTSLMDAIAKVNGVNRRAKTKEIKIYRLNSDPKEPREIISVNYDLIKKGEQDDVMLQPYDIIEVDKSKKPIAQIILETAAGIGTSAATNLGTTLPTRVLY